MTHTRHPTPDTRHPTPLFIHGAGSNRDFWHEQRAAFRYAHYLNLPGHTESRDRSGAGEAMRSIEEYAGWLAQYVESARLENVVLNGHSMGGAIALMLALRHPAWLRALVLTGTGARLPVSPRLLELLRTDYPAAVDLIVEWSFTQPSGPLTYTQRARINGTRRQILRMPQSVTLADYEACNRFDVTTRLGEITVPTLCIVGAQDRMTPPAYSQHLHEAIAGSQLRIIEGAGHMLPLEQPGEYNQALESWNVGKLERSTPTF